MNIRPTRTFMRCLCFIGISFLIHISCSKDNEVLLDAVLTQENNPVVDEDTSSVDDNQSQDQNAEDTDNSSEGE